MQTNLRKTVSEMSAGWTHEFIITHEDLTETTANTAQTIALITIPADTAVLGAGFYLKTAFQDTSDAAFNTTTLIIGDSGDTDRLVTSKELNVNGTEITSHVTPNSVDTLPNAYTSSTVVNAIFGSMAAKSLSDIDAGEVRIFLRLSDLSALT